MKKLLFIYGPLGGGGAERVLIDLLSHLDYTKYEVDLCLMVNQGILLPEVPKKVNIIPLWETYALYYKIAYRLSIYLKSNFLFKRIINKKLPKVYHTEISFLEGMPLKLHALRNNEAKKITWVHCDLFNFPYEAGQFAKGEEIDAYNKMDTIVCVSQDAKNAFVKRFPTCTSNLTVIYNPIAIQKVIQLADYKPIQKNENFTVVVVGRLTEPKRIDRVLRLAVRLKKEKTKIHFQIIGDGELKEELLNLSKELNIEDCVEFLGFQKNPYPFIKNADLMLLSSAYEGFGLVICEAMCLGVPVVSTKTAGPTEIIDNDRYGLLCEQDDESIYQAVKKMIENPSLRNTYQLAGLKRVQDFSVLNALMEFDKLIGE